LRASSTPDMAQSAVESLLRDKSLGTKNSILTFAKSRKRSARPGPS
jgi:hypothetical protein